MLDKTFYDVYSLQPLSDSGALLYIFFHIIVTERSGDSYAKVRIADFHTNICLIEKNGRVLYEKPLLNEEARRDSRVDRSLLNMKDIWDFAETADLQDVADLLA